MIDTSETAARVYRELLMSRSGAERLRMGADMFQAARELSRAALLAEGLPDSGSNLFRRLYRDDFPPAVLAMILEHLDQS